jgi:ankyrin repeat protein
MDNTNSTVNFSRQELSERLIKAVSNGNKDTVIKMAEAGADLNWADESRYINMRSIAGSVLGVTALTAACDILDIEMVKLLIELGADVNAVNLKNQTALYWTAQSCGPFSKSLEIIKTLLDAGADPNIKTQNGRTPFTNAVDYGRVSFIDLFIEYGADVNTRDNRGRTPIYFTLTEPGITDILIRNGARLDVKDINSQTPLSYFCGYRFISKSIIEKLLAAGADPNAPDENMNTPLYEIASSLEDFRSVEAAETLIQYGADVNARNLYGRLPIHQAARRGNTMTLDLLIKSGSELNIADRDGMTVLHEATVCGDEACVNSVLNTDVDINAVNGDGDTPLLIAAKHLSVKIISLIISAGADVNVHDREGMTPLLLVAQRGVLGAIEKLVRSGADPCATNGSGNTYLDILEEFHPYKHKKWLENTVVKARKKSLKREDSTHSHRCTPDFDI